MWKCHCGEENDDSMKFCPSCGSREPDENEVFVPEFEDKKTEEIDNTSEEAPEEAKDNTSDEKDEKNDAEAVVVVRSSAKWTCICGETNPGKAGICRACGKSSYDRSDLSAPTLEAPKTDAIPKEKKHGFFSSFTSSSYDTPPSPPPMTAAAPILTPVAYTPVTYAPVSYAAPVKTPAVSEAPVSGWVCTCGHPNSEISNFCSVCGHPKAVPTEPETTEPEASAVSSEATTSEPKEEIKLPMTTSQGLEGRTITEYIDVVCGTDLYTTGGCANSIQFSYSFEQAKKNLAEKAHDLGADAVIALQTTVFSPQAANIIVSVSGTAVKLDKAEEAEETEE